METPPRDALARLWKEIAEAPAEASGVPETVGRYRVLRRLGDGGSASVFLAEDTSLHRPVALKLLKLSDAGSIARFRREALTAAALDHPNVVKVFDAGEAGGQAYIAMQFIAGEPISGRKLSVPEALRAVQKVAEGLHVAHSKGILHRDVKPGNIMVDERGECYLTDFGLARETQERGVSVSGTILGTPAYMSPEQARGVHRELDARSDVYSLGATLYELVTGRPPHRGQTAFELLQSAVAGDWPAPRKLNPGLPRDVEVILVKAMALEKDRRYRSARELAEDIGRHLAGEAILARPAGLGYRLLRFGRRQRLALGLAAAALVAAGLAAAVLVPALRSEQKRAEDAEAQALSMLRRVAHGATDAILAARRKGETVRVVQEAMQRALGDAYDQAQKQAPHLAEPDYLMGRVERALMRDEQAERYQEKALAKDPRYAPALYEMVVLLSRRYARDFAQAQRRVQRAWVAAAGKTEAEQVREVKEPSTEEVERSNPAVAELRRRIEELCRRLDEKLASAEFSEAAVLSARGISAAKLGRREEAQKLLVDAVGRDPSREEVFETLAEIAPNWDEAERWYSQGLQHDAGYLGHWVGRGGIRSRRAFVLRDREGGPLEACRLAEEDFSRALALDPEGVIGWLGRGSVRINRAAYLGGRGLDAVPDLAHAVEDLTRALELDSKNVEALVKRGGARTNLGVHHYNHGRNPLEEYRLAEIDFNRALELAPDDWLGWNWRGNLHADRAYFKSQSGLDPVEDYTLAESDFRRMIELEKNHAEAWASRGYARAGRGGYRMAKGGDPAPDYQLADEDFKHSLQINPNFPLHWTMRGDLYASWAGYRSNRPDDPAKDYETAIECYTQALTINPEYARAWSRRGSVKSNRMHARMLRGEDPTEDAQSAVKDLDRALVLNPKDTDALSWRGRLFANFGYHKYRSQEDPTSEFKEMEASYARALEIKKDMADVWMGRGFGRMAAGLYDQSQGRDPAQVWSAAEKDFETALSYKADSGWTYFCRAELRFNRAVRFEHLGEKPASGDEYARAVLDYEEAFRLNPSYRRMAEGRLATARVKSRPEY